MGVALSVALLPLAYSLALVVYRLTLHPLARFPGPKLVSATKWIEFFYDVAYGHGGRYVAQIEKMHDKYGPIVRVAPDELHIRDPFFYSTVYAPAPAKRDKYKPAAEMIGVPLGTFGTVEHDVYRKRRLANSVYFSKRSIAVAQEAIYTQVDLLLKNLDKHAQKQDIFRAQTVYLPYTTDSVTSYLFGKPIGYQGNDIETEKWLKTTSALNRVTPVIKQFTWLPGFCLNLPEALLLAVVPPLGRVLSMLVMCYNEAENYRCGRAGKLLAAGDEVVRRGENNLPPTLFHAIDESSLPDSERSVGRLGQEAFVFLAAGADTAARVLTDLTFRLSTQPEALQKMREDLAKVMPTPDARPTLKELETCHYFRACVKEELRILALLTSRLPVVAPNALVYREYTIPARTPVSMTIKDVSMDPNCFPEPRKYIPERWLKDGELHRDLEPFFVPFGKGPRMCQGIDFGYAMIYLSASRVFAKFDLELHDTIKERDVDTHRDYFFGEPAAGSKGVQIRVTGKRTTVC